MNIYYRLPNECLESIYEVQIKVYENWALTDLDPSDKEYILSECAESYHDNCDGHDRHWPLTMEVVDCGSEPCKAIFSGLIGREFDPVFSAALNQE